MCNYKKAEQYLYDLQMFGIKLGLEQVEEFMNLAGKPHSSLRFIHLAGTNGKGSTAAMLSATLIAAGFKVGLYTSPHLISVRERFRINGQAISKQDFSRIINTLKPFVEQMKQENRCPTFFEMTTVMAATYFAEQDVDFVIWETGMGGQFDATNVVTPVCSVITGVSLDHQAYLGDVIQDIAFEKAGIIKEGIPCFCGNLPRDAYEIVQSQALKKNADLISSVSFMAEANVEKCHSENPQFQRLKINQDVFDISLQGEIQLENAMLCYTILLFLADKFTFSRRKALTGFQKVNWPGRLQILPDGNILDGAHNPQGIQGLTDFLIKQYPEEKFTIVFANFADKNAAGCIKSLLPFAAQFSFVPLSSIARKSYSNDELRSMVYDLNPAIPVQSFPAVKDALEQIGNTKKLITGSLYLAGEVLELYFNEDDIINI